MTWRLAIDRCRSDRRREAREHEHEPAAAADSTEDLIARERAGHLWNAIDALPEKLRIVVVLANMEEHEVADVARLLGLPVEYREVATVSRATATEGAAAMDPIDGELRRALAVDPSPEFLARVRTRIAEAPAPAGRRIPWIAVAPLLAVAALLAVVAIVRRPVAPGATRPTC